MTPRIASALSGILLGVVALTGCSVAAPEPDSASPAPRPSATTSAEPVTSPSPSPSASPALPTCDAMISEGTVEAFTDLGWTFEEKEFVIGDVTMSEGLLCFWADYSVASDHGQLYGWSEITPEDATRAQSSLLSQGWTREDGPEGIYITEDPQFSMGTDEAGYGMTYLFGDGWVKVADTREGLILIDWAG
ncbi:hypothetical protein [uncultured Microbacterium sp.]|uniref:hypothetical protein n=1 Tax=uncultured Microbacterium sp. TaxID=191216 RepID=UPI0028D7A26C|nr:hypothetical protein [uncultured Microbacterium sp.]